MVELWFATARARYFWRAKEIRPVNRHLIWRYEARTKSGYSRPENLTGLE